MFEVFADTGRGEDGEEAGRRLGVRLFLDLLGLLVSDHLGRLDLVVRPDHRVRGGVRVSLGSGSKTHGAESGLPLRHQYCSAALRSGELLLWMGAECTHLCLSAVYVCLCSCVRDTLSRCICVCLLFYLPVCPFVVCFSVCVRCECMWGRGGGILFVPLDLLLQMKITASSALWSTFLCSQPHSKNMARIRR